MNSPDCKWKLNSIIKTIFATNSRQVANILVCFCVNLLKKCVLITNIKLKSSKISVNYCHFRHQNFLKLSKYTLCCRHNRT